MNKKLIVPPRAYKLLRDDLSALEKFFGASLDIGVSASLKDHEALIWGEDKWIEVGLMLDYRDDNE